jgi:anti-anti-sigma factor
MLGDIHDSQRKVVLVAFDLPSGLPIGTRTLATVRYCYDAVRGKCGVRQHVLQVDFGVDPSAGPSQPNPEVEAEIFWHRAMALKERAWSSWNTGGPQGARQHFLGAAEILEGHQSLDPSRFQAERMRLKNLAEECVASGRASVGKELVAESSEWHAQRGRYHTDPEAVVRTFNLTPSTHAVLDDVADFLSQKLQGLGYPSELAQRLELALRELVENGLEHGCQGRPDGKAQVELVLGRNHAEVVVRDDGPGFDFKATLGEENKSGGANPSNGRGRGLLLAHRAADALWANTVGNEVRASIRRRKARFDMTSETVINEKGVGVIGVLRLSESLDSQSLHEFRSRLDVMVEQGISALIIDLSHCGYMNSEGLGQMIFTSDRLHGVGSRLVVVSPTPSVSTVMRMLGIDQFFSIAGSIDDAKRLLAS